MPSLFCLERVCFVLCVCVCICAHIYLRVASYKSDLCSVCSTIVYGFRESSGSEAYWDNAPEDTGLKTMKRREPWDKKLWLDSQRSRAKWLHQDLMLNAELVDRMGNWSHKLKIDK